MNVLLDECLPKKLKLELQDHYIKTVPEVGWAGKQNGELLRLAETKFDVFITADQNLTYQQNLKISNIAVVVLVAKSNRLEILKPLMPKLREVLKTIKFGKIVRICS